MSSILTAAVSGNDGLHSETSDDFGCDNTWVDIARIVERARQVATPTQPATIEQSEAEYEADMRKTYDARGLFFATVPKRKPQALKAPAPPPPEPKPLDWPPGLAGQLAQYVYRAAPRPVKEVALVAALGLLAGICGRQWHIPKSGLNLYIILVARSAIGKEGMHSGISTLLAALEKELPQPEQFVDFADYASGPALVKACVESPCFVNVRGEIGRKFKAMAKAKPGDPMDTMRTKLTELYTKSAPNAVAGGIGYSSRDNNVASLLSVSYSLIGETTPGTFLESLSSDMMEDGFMSRLTVIEYDGPRPDEHPSPIDAPPPALVRRLSTLMTEARSLADMNVSVLVRRQAGAGVTLDLFKHDCDRRINATEIESRRQMWNRAHLKVLRIAALLAVADNHMFPCITQAQADWAINLILSDIAAFTKRLDGGDVGSGDDAREGKLATILRDYLTAPVAESYKIKDDMQKNNIVPLHYLQKRTKRAAAFYNHMLGGNRALEETLAGMVAAGYLMEVDKNKLSEAYSSHGRAYRILSLPSSD